MSPLLANIALSVLDEHVHGPWKPGGSMSTESRRAGRRAKGLPTWRVVRYADDFVVMVHGTRQDTEAVREEVAGVLTSLGLRLSEAKTQIVHLALLTELVVELRQVVRGGGRVPANLPA
jgi:RNA-directed DNA polymerase